MRVLLEVVVVLPSCLQWTTSASLHPKRQEWSVVGAVESVLTSHAPCQHACLLLADQHEELEVTQAPRGVRVLQAVGGSVNGSDTRHGRLRETVDGVREVLQDVPRWSTRILVLTRLPLSHLGGLHGLLSNRNAMLLRIQDHKTSRSVRRVGVFVWQPYSAPGSTPLRVATWTPHGRLTLASHMSLFPDKFSVFSSAPRLKVVVEVLPAHSLSWVDDAGEPGGRRLEYTGYISDVVKYFAARMNFTTTYVLSPERTFGSRMPDGSWTGMIGMVVREFPSCLPGKPLLRGSWSANTFSPVRILLQQGEASETVLGPSCRMLVNILKVSVLSGSSCHPLMKTNSALLTPNADVEWPAEWWWWERLVLGLWMLTVLVLGKSYSGNLMSLLAVRYVPQPFQTLRDVLDHPSVVMIWQKYSGYEQLVRDATFGEIREVAGLEKEGRLEFHTQARYKESLDTLVRTGGHVLVDAGNSLKKLVASDFSNKGSVCVAGRGSECRPGGVVHGAHVPPLGRFTHSPPPTVSQEGVCVTCVVLQGVFVLLGGGVVAGLAVWCLEVLVKPCKEH
ncbi:hypothetical protein O3P69_014368 [Scylla paramamosain]|uniref:Ionotropic glutamate receptor L-glutamate and glycine-binding domain-containing protein n=1 Tax=Scylla paramamosain TaxID=85552 RepID=A0AAW0TBR6_SCYPA